MIFARISCWIAIVCALSGLKVLAVNPHYEQAGLRGEAPEHNAAQVKRLRCRPDSPEIAKVHDLAQAFLNDARLLSQKAFSNSIKSSKTIMIERRLRERRLELQKSAEIYDLASCLKSGADDLQEICALSNYHNIHRRSDGALVLSDPLLPGIEFVKRRLSRKGSFGPAYSSSWVAVDKKSKQVVALLADSKKESLPDGKLSQAVLYRAESEFTENKKDYFQDHVIYEEHQNVKTDTFNIDDRIGAFSSGSTCFEGQGNPALALNAIIASGDWRPRDGLTKGYWGSYYTGFVEGLESGRRGLRKGIADVGVAIKDSAVFLGRAAVFLARVQYDPRAKAQVVQALQKGYAKVAPHFQQCWEKNPAMIQQCMSVKVGKVVWNRIVQVLGQCFSEGWGGEELSRCLGATSAIAATWAASGAGSTLSIPAIGLRAQSFGMQGAAIEFAKGLGGAAPGLARAGTVAAVSTDLLVNQVPVDPDMLLAGLAKKGGSNFANGRQRIQAGSRQIASIEVAARRSALNSAERADEISRLLGRNFDAKALNDIHEIGRSSGGYSFDPERGRLRSHYSPTEIAEKRRRARSLGMSEAEIDLLLDQGYFGTLVSRTASPNPVFPVHLNKDDLPPLLPQARRREVTVATTRPAVIQRNSRKNFRAESVYDYERLKQSTKVIDSVVPDRGLLENLPDGTYVWAIASDGRIAVANRALSPDARHVKKPRDPGEKIQYSRPTETLVESVGRDAFGNRVNVERTLYGDADLPISSMAKYLVSHDGLALVLSGGRNTGTPLISSGEFVVRGGRGEVRLITNASGTYPAGQEHLSYGIEELKRVGLPVSDTTQTLDIATKPKFENRAHATAAKQAFFENVVQADPQLKKLFSETQEVLQDAERAGIMRGDGYHYLWDADGNVGPYSNHGVMLITDWSRPWESVPERMMNQIYNSSGIDEFRKVLALVRKATRLKRSGALPPPTEIVRVSPAPKSAPLVFADGDTLETLRKRPRAEIESQLGALKQEVADLRVKVDQAKEAIWTDADSVSQDVLNARIARAEELSARLAFVSQKRSLREQALESMR